MDKGIIYPQIGNLYSHHALAWNYIRTPEGRNPVSLQEINKYLVTSPDKDILLSSEALCKIDDPLVLSKDLKKFVNRPIKIIVYLRRQDYWSESIYNQMVKDKTRLTDKFNSDYKDRGNWQLLIEKWEKAFGKQNLIVKAYGKKEMPQGLIADFLGIFSLKPQSFILPKNANESLDLDLLEIKRLANVIQWHLPPAKLEKINSVLRQRFPQKKYLLSLEERLKILELYSAGNQKVAENYLGKKQLFVDSFPHNCENYPQYKGLEIEKVVVIFLALWKEFSPKTKNFTRIKKKIKRKLIYLNIVIVLQGIFIIYLLTRQIL